MENGKLWIFGALLCACAVMATLATTSTEAGAVGATGSAYIAPGVGTTIPVYDTAWQMLVLASPAEADEYFAALKANGFSGAWTGVIHHAPATYRHPFRGGGEVAALDANGNVVLTPEYIAHARSILDAADVHDLKVGLVAAWQNLYLPGGGADTGNPVSNQVRGTIDEDNAYVYGEQLVAAFGDHPAVSMWVFGGDAGTNNTEANKEVWRRMAAGVRDAGSELEITYHTPTSPFDQLNYAGEPWLDFIAPETGHGQHAAETEAELIAAGVAYGLPVWQGEPRYFNINFNWVPAAFRNPGVAEVEADAIAARNAGVAGYVYGDAGRWHWCQNFGDSSPCDRANIADSFGEGEAAVIAVFQGEVSPISCSSLTVTVDIGAGQMPTSGDDMILGTPGPDVINGIGGDDVICGMGGDDTINAGPGDDWVDGGLGDDQIFGLDGHDDLEGSDGADTIVGGNGNDVIDSGAGNDTANGGAGDDTLHGGDGNDELFGQGGADTLNGGDGDDLLVGVDGIDILNGGAGADTLNGGPGNDTLNGNAGNDLLFGLAGDDVLNGGNDDDRVFGQAGSDTVTGGLGDDKLWGNEADDTLTDPSGANIMNGGPGDDTITGGTGDDEIFGDGDVAQAGNDVIDGGAGVDLLVGFAGQDTIISNDGTSDTVNGGPDVDSCTTDGVDAVFNCE